MAIIEAKYTPKFIREFNRLSSEASREYASQESYDVSIEKHRGRVEKILDSLYTSASKASIAHVRDEAGKAYSGRTETKKVIDSFMRLAKYFGTQKITRSGMISKTTADIIERTIKKAIDGDEGEIVGTKEIARQIAAATGGEVMGYRADRIARTETLSSFNRANLESTKDLDLPDDVVLLKKWVPAGGSRTRDTHRKMKSHDPIGMNEKFRVGKGFGEHPGDSSLPPEELINCLHPETRISFTSPKRLFKRHYVGKMIRIKLPGGNELSVTPHHPILTERGFVAAHAVNKFDKIIVNGSSDLVNSVDLQIIGMNPTVSEVYDSFSNSWDVSRVGAGVVDFHGDIPNSDVEIISKRGLLMDGVKPHSSHFGKDFQLHFSDTINFIFPDDSSCNFFLFRSLLSSHGVMGGLSDFIDLLRGCVLKSNQVSFGSASDLEAELFKASRYYITGDSQTLGDFQDGEFHLIKLFNFLHVSFPGLFESDSNEIGVIANGVDVNSEMISNFAASFPLIKKLMDIYSTLRNIGVSLCSVGNIKIDTFHYEGPVYNIEDDKIFYCASTIINRNCRCVLSYVQKQVESEIPQQQQITSNEPSARDSQNIDLGFKPLQTSSGVKIGDMESMGRVERGFHERAGWSKDADEDLLIALRYAPPLDKVTRQKSRGSYYAPSEKRINMSPEDSDLEGIVWRHEYGHSLDYASGRMTYLSYELSDENRIFDQDARLFQSLGYREAFDKYETKGAAFADEIIGGRFDYQALDGIPLKPPFTHETIKTITGEKFSDVVKSIVEETKRNLSFRSSHPSFDRFQKSTLQNLGISLEALKDGQLGGSGFGSFEFLMKFPNREKQSIILTLADLFGAVTEEKIGFGHGIDYYMETKRRRGAEAFANFVALLGGENAKTYDDMIKKALPGAYGVLRQVLKDMNLNE